MPSPTQVTNPQIKDSAITDAKVSASAAIALSKLAQVPITPDGATAFTADQSHGGHKITSLGTPTASTDGATKGYVDTVAQGLSAKTSVRAVTTGALAANTYANGSSGVGATLTANANGALAAQDGVTLVANDRLLVKNEAAPANNGVYIVTQVGTGGTPYILTRATDFDGGTTEIDGAFMFVEEGTANADTQWVCTTTGAVTMGTTAITFTQFFSASATSAGNGLTKSGNTISAVDDPTGGANLSRSVNVSGNGLAVKVDGATIEEGASSRLRVKDGGVTAAKIATAAVGAGSGLQISGSQIAVNRVTRETPSGTINGSNTVFTLANTPMSGTEEVHLNGLLYDAGGSNDYTISGASITFVVAPVSGDKIRVSYFI